MNGSGRAATNAARSHATPWVAREAQRPLVTADPCVISPGAPGAASDEGRKLGAKLGCHVGSKEGAQGTARNPFSLMVVSSPD